MTVRGTILVGLLLCTALLAGTRLMPAPSRAGACEAIEVVTGRAGYKPGYHTFKKRHGPYGWFILDGKLVIEGISGGRVELVKSTVEIFNCALPTP